MSIVGMSNLYKQRPSALFGIKDEYTAFCFDEACAYIIKQLENKKEPQFKAEYKSFSDIYSQYT
jgi:hypothetical protein